MLVLPDGFLCAVSPSFFFMKYIIIRFFSYIYIVVYVHIDEMVGIESVLITKHHVCATGIATFSHIVEIAHPPVGQIAKMNGCSMPSFMTKSSKCVSSK